MEEIIQTNGSSSKYSRRLFYLTDKHFSFAFKLNMWFTSERLEQFFFSKFEIWDEWSERLANLPALPVIHKVWAAFRFRIITISFSKPFPNIHVKQLSAVRYRTYVKVWPTNLFGTFSLSRHVGRTLVRSIGEIVSAWLYSLLYPLLSDICFVVLLLMLMSVGVYIFWWCLDS